MTLRRLFYLYLIVLLIPQLDVCVTERMVGIGKVVLILLPLAFYWLFLLAFKKPSKAFLWAFPFAFLGAFQIVLGYLYGHGVIGVDMWLTLTTTSPNEAGEMLTQIYPSVAAVCIIYLPTLIYAISHVKREEAYTPKFLRRMRQGGWAMLAVALIPTAMALGNKDYHFMDDFFPVNVCYNFKLALDRAKLSAKYVDRVKDFRFGVTESDNDTIPEVVLMVVGETSRATNWGIFGYERETTPRLAKTPNLLVFTDCMSQSNTTHKSVPIILSAATAEDFDVLYESKGILAAADEAGWATAFLSNEPRNHSFNDFLGEQAREVRFQRDSLHGSPYDNLLVPLFKDALQRHAGERFFMVIHTYGAHPTYSDRYTREEAFFLPDRIIKSSKDTRDVLINAYDNAIRMTDGLLADFIAALDSTGRPAAMLYVSDHGEDIFDDHRNMYMHASPYPSYYQLHVPLLCWTSDAYNALHGERVALMAGRQKDPLQTDCAYPTLLSLMGIQCRNNQTTLSLADKNYRKKTRRSYLNDHNKTMRLEEMLDAEDIEVMKQRGMFVQE